MTELFYYIQAKENYQALIGDYTLLIETYRKIISNNDSYHKTLSNKCNNILKDNMLFQNMIINYSQTISDLNSYILLLNIRINEIYSLQLENPEINCHEYTLCNKDGDT
jgi:hypothetical protein